MKKSNQPIRIAVIIGKWLGGGVEAVMMNYYRHIDKSKIQFDFICDSDSTDIPYKEIEELGGKVIIVPPYQKLFKYIKELKKIFKENNYKIVHSNINALSVFPLYAAKKVGVPVRIAHSHSTANKKEWKKTLIKNVLKTFSKVYATHYFACTEHAGRWLFGNKTFDEGKVTIINNAIELDKYKYNDKVRKLKRKELKIGNDVYVIGHIGRFVEQKNHRFLIDIFNEIHKKNPKTRLLLAGQGPLIEEMKNKVMELGIDDSVKFLGQRTDASELYQAFDLFLLPSLYEGLGMVAIEAQVSGLPCIVSTEVPIIAKVSNDVTFIDLNESNNIWVESVEKAAFGVRKDNVDMVRLAGYDILTEVKKLENNYIKMIEMSDKNEY